MTPALDATGLPAISDEAMRQNAEGMVVSGLAWAWEDTIQSALFERMFSYAVDSGAPPLAAAFRAICFVIGVDRHLYSLRVAGADQVGTA